jgi:hypothetical protein
MRLAITNTGSDAWTVDCDPDRRLLSRDFAEWFAEYVNAVVAGDYVYSDDYGRLMPRDEL